MVASMTGTIEELNASKFADDGGYGFIRAADGERLYFNTTGLQLSSVQFGFLKVGDPCRFTAIDHPAGPRAIEVFVADPNQQGLPL
jgi:cold shock CspA family protein